MKIIILCVIRSAYTVEPHAVIQTPWDHAGVVHKSEKSETVYK